MNSIEKANRAQIAIVGSILFLQLLLFLSLVPLITDEYSSAGKILKTLVLLEFGIFFIFFSYVRKRFFSAAISIYLFFTVNLFTPILISGFGTLQYKTLPKNLTTNVQIVGDVMPGFSGVSRVSTDHKGFRVSSSINYEQKKDIRIFAIGGSTTEQIFIDDRKTWTALLENKFQQASRKQVEVINTGVSGLRAEQHYYTLLNIRQYSPDIVIFLMGINDWNQHIKGNFVDQHTNDKTSEKYPLTDLFSLIDIRKSLLYVSIKSFGDFFKTSKGAATVRIEDGSYYSSQNDSLSRSIVHRFQPQTVSKDFQFWVQKIANLCRESNFDCMFINQPVAYRNGITKPLRERLWMTPPNERYTLPLEDMQNIAALYNSWLLDFSSKNNIESCNIADKVPPTTDYFYDDCHYNEGGARKISLLVNQCLVDLKTKTAKSYN